jgi:hypothetical protein
MSGDPAAAMAIIEHGQQGVQIGAVDYDKHDNDGEEVDPKHLEALENALTGSAAALEDNLLLAGLIEIQTAEILTADTEKYFAFFSKINVACFSRYRGGSGDPTVDYAGGSKDPLSRSQHMCPNNKFGCPYQTPRADTLNDHVKTCIHISIDAVPQTAQHALVCPFKEECGKTFKFQSQLDTHLEQVHDQPRPWTPKACEVADCSDKTVWQTKSAFHEHTRKRHSKWQPTSCTFPGCTTSTVYQQASSLGRHLRTAHEVTGKAAQKKYIYPAAREEGEEDE